MYSVDPIEDLVSLQAARALAASGTGRALREAAGISQSELGAAIGVSGQTVSHWELGHRRPCGPAARRYVAALEALGARRGR